jgi:hypothetical protein
MLEEVIISNYKSVLHQRFKLGRVNVFAGPDGSGKTNILEALGMASSAHDGVLDTQDFLKRGIKSVKPSLIFHSSPGKQEQSKEIEVSWYEKSSWKKSKLVCDNPDGNNPSWKDISWYEQAYIDKVNNLIASISDGTIEGAYPFDDEEKNITINAAFRGSRNFRDYLIYNINMDALSGETNQSDIRPLGIYGEGLDEFLSSFTDVQIQDLNSFGLVSYAGDISASDSLPALFYLALFLERRTPAFFAVDNIESLMSPDVCSKLITDIAKLATKNKKQALITTNNPAIVRGLDVNDPAIKLFTVKMADDGQTIVEEITDKTLVEI